MEIIPEFIGNRPSNEGGHIERGHRSEDGDGKTG